MLKIRPEQMEAFKSVADAAFTRELAEYLHENYPDISVQLPTGTFAITDIPDETLLEMIQHGISRARSYGISWESTLASFISIMFVAAPNFDTHSLIHQGLTNEKIPPNARLDSLLEQTSEQDWHLVGKNYDPHSWHISSRRGNTDGL